MKILWLGSSNDVGGYLPEEKRPPFLVRNLLAQALQTDVEVEARAMWPSERLPALVESLMEEHDPDLVLFKTNMFSFCYESVPLKIERKLGKVGRLIANVGLKSAGVGWLSSNSVFHAGRRLAVRTIGGVTYFEPDEVLERMAASIRVILRSENTALLVRGPRGGADYFIDESRLVRGEARRQVVVSGLQQLCDDLHVTLDGSEASGDWSATRSRLGDRVHLAASEHETDARDLIPLLLEAWAQLHREVEAAPTTLTDSGS